MLNPSWVQNISLLIFSGLLIEVLTPTTLIFVLLGTLLIFFKVKLGKTARNILALLVFASYWVTYGKIIDPEVGLNFLTSIIVLKIMERETLRDQYMIFFGLLLLISAGSLFERTISYVIFFAVSFGFLIRDFYAQLGQRWRLRDLRIGLLWIIPLTFFLFFMVPRMLNPIPFQQGGRSEGEVGYTPDVNISQLESLSSNTSLVFQVLVSRPLHQEELYWRGNTLSYSDGWNWNIMTEDRARVKRLKFSENSPGQVKQSFRLFSRADYFFTLDVPFEVSYGNERIELLDSLSVPQRRWQWVQRYEAQSFGPRKFQNTEDLNKYLALPLSKKTKKWIEDNFRGKTVHAIQDELKRYFNREKFSYSLSPGRSASFEEFMQTKKIGLCSHYASALAIILRAKKIPARLVSGFMGGSYNRFADFYLISQNDAHVWVEALEDNHWQRMDPTEWIAPDRVRLGGEAFMESVRNGTFEKNRSTIVPKMFQDLKQWFSQWDFMFYVWLEEMDYHTQDAWLTRLKFKREWLFSIVPLLMVGFMLMYMWFLNNKKKSDHFTEHQETWSLFVRKMKKAGLSLSTHSILESQKQLEELNHPKKDQILNLWQELIEASFSEGEIQDIRKKIKRL